MPHNGRARLREQARITRDEGETVVLLISDKPANTSRATPFSVVTSEAPEATSADTQIPIYARVKYRPGEAITYAEGGRVKNLKADIIASTDPWLPQLQACYAVRLEDGTVLRKASEALSDTKIEYTLYCEGFLNVSN